MNTRVRVVSLARSQDRRRAFAERAAGSRIAWSFFDAHAALDPALSYDPAQAIATVGAPLSPGELGCYSSHYTVWREFLASADDQLIVLEDDVVVDWPYLEFLAAKDLGAAGVRYLRLFAKRPSPFRAITEQFLEFNHALIQFSGYAWGTQGYVVTRDAAKVFVERLHCVRRALDTGMDRSWDHGIPNLAVFPFPLFELYGPSLIGASRYEQVPLPLATRLRRLPVRAAEKARRMIGDRRHRLPG